VVFGLRVEGGGKQLRRNYCNLTEQRPADRPITMATGSNILWSARKKRNAVRTARRGKHTELLHFWIREFSFIISWGGVRLSPLGTSATIWPTVPDPDDRWWWVWSSRWIENWQRKRSTLRKPGPAPLCSPQITYDLTLDRTRTAAVGSQRLTAWAMARHQSKHYNLNLKVIFAYMECKTISSPLQNLLNIINHRPGLAPPYSGMQYWPSDYT
jgi:hypothetical protein